MKLHIANDSDARVGGGPNFARQLQESLETVPIEEADIILIPAATMVTRESIAPYFDRKIVLRIDNYLKHSRNRGSGMTRLVEYAQACEVALYQSKWAKGYLNGYLKQRGIKNDSRVLYNGSDESIFRPGGKYYSKPAGVKRYLYVASSTDQSKGWVMAHQKFQELHRDEDCELWLVGKFDEAVREYGFDFFNDEQIVYKGIVQEPEEMAKIYRSCDALLYSYFCDACSNILNEAILCGLEIVDCYGMLETGGAPEVLKNNGRTLTEMCYNYKKLFEEL